LIELHAKTIWSGSFIMFHLRNGIKNLALSELRNKNVILLSGQLRYIIRKILHERKIILGRCAK
jgi:hypothetical protein